MPLQDYIVQLVSWAIGSTLLHSAACVINDICDRDFDRQVGECALHLIGLLLSYPPVSERCKTRPIASGQVSVFGATVFLCALMAPCMALLSSINPLAILIALPGIVPLHALSVTSREPYTSP
jgi:4-hydroxybenzoate polyprenyltransferase